MSKQLHFLPFATLPEVPRGKGTFAQRHWHLSADAGRSTLQLAWARRASNRPSCIVLPLT